MKKDVFISYSSKENSTAYTIRDVLERNGISCWMAPESIPYGSDYSEEIPRGIEESSVFLLLVSDNAQASRWVKNEMLKAVSLGKTIIPFFISKCEMTESFDFSLGGPQRWYAYENLSDNLEKLVKHIKALIGVTSSKSAETKKQEKKPANVENKASDSDKEKSLRE